ncbi:MAG: hypothetical protein ACRED5_21020 [Propylenella sp.]
MTRRRAPLAADCLPGDAYGFDYDAPAEIFMTRARFGGKSPISYRRFDTAAEAIQFAVEQVPTPLLVGAILEVKEQRYDHRGIRELYDRETYPLARL